MIDSNLDCITSNDNVTTFLEIDATMNIVYLLNDDKHFSLFIQNELIIQHSLKNQQKRKTLTTIDSSVPVR